MSICEQTMLLRQLCGPSKTAAAVSSQLDSIASSIDRSPVASMSLRLLSTFAIGVSESIDAPGFGSAVEVIEDVSNFFGSLARRVKLQVTLVRVACGP